MKKNIIMCKKKKRIVVGQQYLLFRVFIDLREREKKEKLLRFDVFIYLFIYANNTLHSPMENILKKKNIWYAIDKILNNNNKYFNNLTPFSMIEYY